MNGDIKKEFNEIIQALSKQESVRHDISRETIFLAKFLEATFIKYVIVPDEVILDYDTYSASIELTVDRRDIIITVDGQPGYGIFIRDENCKTAELHVTPKEFIQVFHWLIGLSDQYVIH